MAVYKPPLLDKAAPIVQPDGRITPYFQRFWQNLSFVAADGSAAAVNLSGKVDKNLSAGWTACTGTTSKTAFATYTAPAISAVYSQAEVQALANHVQILSQQLAAVKAGLLTASVFAA